jgi:WD40 repeat protein
LIAALLCAFLAGALGVAIQWLRAEEKARAESVARANAEAEQDRALNNLYFSRIAQARLEWRLNNTVGAQQLLEYCDPARRGWEWHYLSNLSRCEIFGLRSTELSYVVSVTFSPDGSQFAFTGFDPYRPPDTQRVSPVEIWDARTCERIQTLAGPEHALRLSYSPDGRRLVASSGREAKIWNLESGRLERAWFPNGTVTFSQDGRSLVSADSAGVAISNAETGEIIRRFSSKVGRALFSPDGRIVAVSGIDAVVLFDATSGQVLQTLQHGTSDSEAQSTRFFTPEGPEIAFSPDCERVAVATFPPRIWEVRSGQILHQLSGHNGAVNGIAFSPDGQLVATGGIDSTVRVWNAANGGEQAVLRGHAAFVGCVAFHPDGWSLVSGGRHIGEVKLWDLTRPQESTNLPETGAAGIAFDPDGDHIKLVSPTGRIKVRASDSGTTTLGPVVELNMRWMTPAAMTEWSSDARMLATVARDRQQIKLWNMNAPATPVTLTGLTAPASYLAISSSGDRVAAAGLFAKDRSRFREIMVWDTGSGKPLARFSPALAATTFTHGRVALSPDGSRVAFDDYKLSSAAPSQPSESVTTSELRICEVTSGREILRIPLGESVIYCLAFSHDGKLIAAGDDDGQLCVIDAESGRVLKRQRQSQSLFRLAFSPDGRRLAGINREKVQIWNIPDLQDVLVLRGAQPRSLDGGFNPVMAWSQDGRQLASLNWDGSISVWNGSERPNLVADRVKEATSRIFAWHLTQAESAISRQQPASALRHLSRLMISKPPDVSSLLRRAQLSLRLGRWEESGDDFAAWLKAGAPADDCASASYGRLLVARGDHAGYEQLCQHSIDALRKDTNAETAWSAVGVFALAPGSSADAATVLQIAERQIPVEVRTVEQAYALALVAYRAGNFDVADKRLRSFADHHDLWSARTRPLRAMLDYHLGHVNRAREELARAIAWASDQTSGATATAPAGERAISELLMDFQALCREGQALLDQSNEAKASSVKKTS